MQLKVYSCSNCVGKNVNFTKYGKTRDGKQRYRCKMCKKTSVLKYSYNAYKKNINAKIIQFTKEGLGIRSTARVLEISPTTLIKRILHISAAIRPPKVNPKQSYELDELCSYIRKKTNRFWLVYAINKDSGDVVSFNIGKRNNRTLRKVVGDIIEKCPTKIFTDSLRNYKFLIPKQLHETQKYGTNHIERKNLSLRTHLKRLNRRTICFSRSIIVFKAIMKIYFWADYSYSPCFKVKNG